MVEKINNLSDLSLAPETQGIIDEAQKIAKELGRTNVNSSCLLLAIAKLAQNSVKRLLPSVDPEQIIAECNMVLGIPEDNHKIQKTDLPYSGDVKQIFVGARHFQRKDRFLTPTHLLRGVTWSPPRIDAAIILRRIRATLPNLFLR